MAKRESVVLDGLPLNSGSFYEYVDDLDPALWLPLGVNGLTDVSGNARDGTAVGGLTVGGNAGIAAGDSGAATNFDGTDDYVTTSWLTEINYWLDPTATSVANITSMTTGTPATLSIESTIVQDGSTSYKAVTPGAVNAEGWRSLTSMDVHPSETYSFGVWVFAPAGQAMRIVINERDAADAQIATTNTGWAASGGWEFKSVSHTFGATGVKLRIQVQTNSVAAVTFYSDKISVVRAATVTDADWLSGTQSAAYWEGTANASRSVRGPFINQSPMTFMGIAQRDTTDTVDTLIAGSTATNSPRLRIETNGGVAFAPDASGADTTWPASTWPLGIPVVWALTVSPNADTARLRLYYATGSFDSTLAMTPSYTTPGAFRIGRRTVGSEFDGKMQHVLAFEGDVVSTEEFTAAAKLALANWGYVLRGELEMGPPVKRFRRLAKTNGNVLVDTPGHEGREIGCSVRVWNATSMDNALDRIAAVEDKLAKAERTEEGIPLIWTPAGSTRSVTAYVTSGEISLPINVQSGYFKSRPEFGLRLDCDDPFLYGAEVTVSTVTNTDPMQLVTIADLPGDVPASGALVVTDNATQLRRFVEWGMHTGTTAQTATDLILDSDELTITGYAGTGNTRSGAYDPGGAGNSVIRGTTSPSWVALCSTGDQTHVGSYRIKARVWTDAAASEVRLAWRAGDSDYETNDLAAPPQVSQWVEVDLGVIDIPVAELGTQRWEGRIEFRADAAGSTFDLDVLRVIPVSDGYGKARAPVRLGTPSVFSARDEFDQSAGALTGKTAPIGGVWAGAGDAAGPAFDFTVETTGKTAQRTEVSDADINTGRYATIPVTLAAVAVRCDLKFTAVANTMRFGILARYVDVNNWLALVLEFADPTIGLGYLRVYKRVTSTVTLLGEAASFAYRQLNTWYTLALQVDTGGNWIAFLGMGVNTPGSAPSLPGDPGPVLYGGDSVLATGGALDDGRIGIYDAQTSADANTRNYNNLSAWVPSVGVVIPSGQSLEIRSDDTLRENAAGTIYGRPPIYRGSRFFIPQAGEEDLITRIAVSARRNDIDEFPNDQIADSTSVAVRYRPRWRTVPRQ